MEKNQITESKRELTRKLMKNDMLDLAYSPEKLKALTRIYNANRDAASGTAMSRRKFMELVKIDIGEGKRAKVDEDLFCNFFEEDGNGLIDLKQFLRGLSYWKKHLSRDSEKLLFYFLLFDKNQDRILDRSEFRNVVVHVLMDQNNYLDDGRPRAPSDINPFVQDIVNEIFKNVKKADCGAVCINDIMTFVAQTPGVIDCIDGSIDTLQAMFHLYDKDSNGRVGEVEFIHMLTKTHVEHQIGKKRKSTDIHLRAGRLVDMTFEKVDINKSGTIEYEEYRAWVLSDPEAQSCFFGRCLDHSSEKVDQSPCLIRARVAKSSPDAIIESSGAVFSISI